MNYHKYIYCLILLGFLIFQDAFCQDVSAFSNKSNYKLSGNFNIGGNYYNYSGTGSARYVPYGYALSGNLRLQLGAITLPFNFRYNNISHSISSPFNVYGISPYYKWVKLHIGYRTLQFSPLVFSGKTFLGAGIELTPGKFELIAFKGTLRNPLTVIDTIVAGATILPQYKRTALGAKIGYKGKRFKFNLSGIKVKDDFDTSIETKFAPEENLVLGANISTKILKRLLFKVNFSTSLFTSDQNVTSFLPQNNIIDFLKSIISINNSSRVSWAGNALIRYDFKGYSLGLEYKRVQPFYESLGINFIRNDIENYNAKFKFSLLNRKLRLSGSLGFQRDNLNNQNSYTTKRIIGSAMATYLPSKKINLIFRYSNYQYNNESGLQIINDTVRILTTTQTLMFSTMLNLIDNKSHKISFQGTAYNNTVVDGNTYNTGYKRDFKGLGANVKLLYNYKPASFNIGPVLNYNQYESSIQTTGRVGAGMNISIALLDNKWRNTLNGLIYQNQVGDKANGTMIQASFSSTYRLKNKHLLSLRSVILKNDPIVGNKFIEWRTNLTYGFTF